jgi:hypothetical protein
MAGKTGKSTGVRSVFLELLSESAKYQMRRPFCAFAVAKNWPKKGLTSSRLYGNFCTERNNRND